MKKEVPYLYSKVSDKIEELMKTKPRMEMSLEELKRDLPGKVKLTRVDVKEVIQELDKGTRFFVDGNKLKKR